MKHVSRANAVLAILFLGAATSCAVERRPRTGPPPRPEASRRQRATPRKLVMEPIRLHVKPAAPGKEPTIEVLDAGGLFDRGGQLLSAKRYEEAIATYDRLLTLFPSSRYVSPALYNAGLSHEWTGQFARAARRYEELIRRFGHTKEAVDAGFRLGGCHAELRNFAESARVFQVLLARGDLGASDRIECLARKGLAHFRMGDHKATRSTLQLAIQYEKSIQTVERLESDFFLAMANYYIAAIPHVEFRKLELIGGSPGPNLARTLNEKARLLILSQAGYIRTIKVKNPYWASASGFQIGSLYREFYTALLTALPDFTRQAKQNARLAKIPVGQAHRQLVQVYMEEVHKAVKPLLGKAMRVFEKNVEMAERVGVRGNWVNKSRRQIQDLKRLLSVSPQEAVNLVRKDGLLPEDQPAPGHGPRQPASTQPVAPPTPPPPVDTLDEPGRAIL